MTTLGHSGMKPERCVGHVVRMILACLHMPCTFVSRSAKAVVPYPFVVSTVRCRAKLENTGGWV